MRGEGKRVAQEGQMRVDQLQQVVGKLRAQNQEVAGESERAISKLVQEKQ